MEYPASQQTADLLTSGKDAGQRVKNIKPDSEDIKLGKDQKSCPNGDFHSVKNNSSTHSARDNKEDNVGNAYDEDSNDNHKDNGVNKFKSIADKDDVGILGKNTGNGPIYDILISIFFKYLKSRDKLD
ncbi:hypothetical protein ElyMa_003217100 [Elysia marginata]|uniref:Uncharacterized protein n=1 Tax=Elysia marginata TaxID=1093978 RepID=A0AAV4J2L2_9GAST|nr:hypothetical protein ElyMa_003217100 [Elysia marginata]